VNTNERIIVCEWSEDSGVYLSLEIKKGVQVGAVHLHDPDY
jgi:hypothetical protein